MKLNFLFCDNMILQRNRNVAVWGEADSAVKISIDGNFTKADPKDGKFMASLPPHAEGGPFTMLVEGDGEVIEIKNVYYGDVYLAGGQSNMGLTLADAMQPLDECKMPVKIFTPDRKWECDKRPLTDMRWVDICVENAYGISAAASHFAIDIANSQNVPVGILSSNQGASCIRSWVSPETTSTDPVFGPETKHHRNAYTFEFNGNSDLYIERLLQVAPYTIKGVIWYQGESDADECISFRYAYMFDLMVKDWRKLWDDPDLPFITVQLTYHTVEEPTFDWEILREQQLKAMLEGHNIGMITIGDAGDLPDIHPKNKKIVGQRLAIYARGMLYGEDIVYQPPICTSMQVEDGVAVLKFINTGDGLYEKKPLTFLVLDKDGNSTVGKYSIHGDTVKVWADGVEPYEIRFCFDAESEVMLYSSADLPASPFRIKAE